MDKKVNCNSEFRCNKNYASNSSLCNHKKKFHKNETSKCSINVQKCSNDVQKCSLSKKIFRFF